MNATGVPNVVEPSRKHISEAQHHSVDVLGSSRSSEPQLTNRSLLLSTIFVPSRYNFVLPCSGNHSTHLPVSMFSSFRPDQLLHISCTTSSRHKLNTYITAFVCLDVMFKISLPSLFCLETAVRFILLRVWNGSRLQTRCQLSRRGLVDVSSFLCSEQLPSCMSTAFSLQHINGF